MRGEMMKSGMVMLPLSKFEVTDGEENVSPQEGDSVELSGTVHMVKNGIAHVMVEHAMAEGESSDKTEDKSEGEDSMSEEERMMDLAKKSDEEKYS
jgi:hypothetical protein